jgi:hypothetical protein
MRVRRLAQRLAGIAQRIVRRFVRRLHDDLLVSLRETFDACPASYKTACWYGSANRSMRVRRLAQRFAGMARRIVRPLPLSLPNSLPVRIALLIVQSLPSGSLRGVPSSFPGGLQMACPTALPCPYSNVHPKIFRVPHRTMRSPSPSPSLFPSSCPELRSEVYFYSCQVIQNETVMSHPGSSGMTRTGTVYRQEVYAARSWDASERLVRARTIRSVYAGAPAP